MVACRRTWARFKVPTPASSTSVPELVLLIQMKLVRRRWSMIRVNASEKASNHVRLSLLLMTLHYGRDSRNPLGSACRDICCMPARHLPLCWTSKTTDKQSEKNNFQTWQYRTSSSGFAPFCDGASLCYMQRIFNPNITAWLSTPMSTASKGHDHPLAVQPCPPVPSVSIHTRTSFRNDTFSCSR